MTQEDKELLFKDLCGRLPYGIKVQHQHQDYLNEVQTIEKISKKYGEIETESVLGFVDDFKPYLFPMSSMTEEQKEEYCQLQQKIIYNSYGPVNVDVINYINWCYKNHIDINGLIPMDLAIDATGLNIYN